MEGKGIGLDELKAYINEKLTGAKSEVISQIYPVGSVITSFNTANPATYLGMGTWALESVGKVLMGTDDTEEIGTSVGSDTVTLTTAQMPSHNHGGATGDAGSHTHGIGALAPKDKGNWWSANVHAGSKTNGGQGYPGFLGGQNEEHGGWQYIKRPSDTNMASNMRDKDWYKADNSSAHGHTINSEGSGEAVSVVQASLKLFIWRRTA